MLFGFMQVFIFGLAGFLVSFNYLAEKFPGLEKVREQAELVKVYFGFIVIFVGIWSLFSPYSRDTRPLDFIGDLFPSVFSILSGLILSTVVFKYVNFSEDPMLSEERKGKVINLLESYSNPIGLATLGFAALHLIDVVGGGYPLI